MEPEATEKETKTRNPPDAAGDRGRAQLGLLESRKGGNGT